MIFKSIHSKLQWERYYNDRIRQIIPLKTMVKRGHYMVLQPQLCLHKRIKNATRETLVLLPLLIKETNKHKKKKITLTPRPLLLYARGTFLFSYLKLANLLSLSPKPNFFSNPFPHSSMAIYSQNMESKLGSNWRTTWAGNICHPELPA